MIILFDTLHQNTGGICTTCTFCTGTIALPHGGHLARRDLLPPVINTGPLPCSLGEGGAGGSGVRDTLVTVAQVHAVTMLLAGLGGGVS